MFLKIYYFIRGYLGLRVKGVLSFRFINLLTEKGIYIWDITSEGEYIYFFAGRHNKKAAEETAAGTGCRIEAVCERGLPLFLKKLKIRWVFTAGAVLFSLFLLISTRYIWLIEVRGNYRINTGDILEFCRENKLTYGTKKSGLDTNLIEKEIKNNFEDISFASVTVKGTRALITVSETLPFDEEKTEEAAGDIISGSEAVVTRITVTDGTPAVKEGMAVGKGDILISGEVFLKAEQEVLGSYMTAARGKIYGKTREKYNFTLPLKEKYKKYTEKEYSAYEVEIFNKNFSLNIIKRDTNSEKCDKIESKRQLKLWNDIYLPIIINKTEYLPYNLYERDLTAEAAKAKAEKIITAEIINEYPIDSEVLGKSINIEKTGEGYRIEAEITLIKQIGVFRER